MSDKTKKNVTMTQRIKALTDGERIDIKQRGREGEALCLRELAVYYGYSYSVMCRWKADGLPLVNGKIPVKQAWIWASKQAEACAN